MKKILSVLFVLLSVFALSISVSAAGLNASEQAILDKLKSIDINGIKLDAKDIAAAENYFLRDDVEITESQSAKIISFIEQAEQIVRNSGLIKTSVSGTENAQVSDLVNKSANDNKIISLAYKPVVKSVSIIPTADTATTSFSLSDLSASDKTQILNLAKDACKEAGLSLSYNPIAKSVAIVDKSGTAVFNKEDVIKNTGGIDFGVTFVVFCGLSVLSAAAFITAKKARLF